jgi:hypothetical protein
MSPAFADETTINLNQERPYVDVPIEATEPTQITIQTTTGTPNDVGFIDSWIELWQDTTRIAFNDDGAHSGQNVLASYLSLYLDAGFYFIRATSYAYACCNSHPTGSYLLTWSGVTTIPTATPTPTTTPEPTPEPIPTSELTPSATPEPTPTEVSPTPTPEPTPETTQEPVVNNSSNEIQVTPSPEAIPEPTETAIQEPEIVEQIVEPETIQTPIAEPVLSVEQIQEQVNQQYIAENTIELQVPTALADIPGVAQIFAATEAILNVGSDMTQEQREESQSVVVAAIIVTQIASMASASASQSQRNKK